MCLNVAHDLGTQTAPDHASEGAHTRGGTPSYEYGHSAQVLSFQARGSSKKFFGANSSAPRSSRCSRNRIASVMSEMESTSRPSYPLEEPNSHTSGLMADENMVDLNISFVRELEDLGNLQEGWDGANELPPSKAILSEVLRIACRIATESSDIGLGAMFPDLAPGFKGEVGMEYWSESKELCIEISPIPRPPTVRLLMVSKDSDGKIAQIVHGDPRDLSRAVRWFLEDESC